jgi:spectinomycin phosphotransferase
MEPAGLDIELLVRTIAGQYPVTSPVAEFRPLGEDSWAYRIDRWWVSVRRDLRGHVPAAYRLAFDIRRAGLEFVLAPRPGADGRIVRQVGGFPVVVFPCLDVAPLTGQDLSPSQLDRVHDMIARVHAHACTAPVPTETFRLSFDDDLTAAFAPPRLPEVGPYGPRLNRLIAAHRSQVARDRAEVSRLGSYCAAAMGRPVITHGEPSAPNILTRDGRFLLADWGAAAWGPPERDWFHVRRTFDTTPACRPEFLRFYELRWRLSEIAEYTARFRTPHGGDHEDDAMWGRLLHYLPE